MDKVENLENKLRSFIGYDYVYERHRKNIRLVSMVVFSILIATIFITTAILFFTDSELSWLINFLIAMLSFSALVCSLFYYAFMENFDYIQISTEMVTVFIVSTCLVIYISLSVAMGISDLAGLSGGWAFILDIILCVSAGTLCVIMIYAIVNRGRKKQSQLILVGDEDIFIDEI